jgi:hypothetical protein
MNDRNSPLSDLNIFKKRLNVKQKSRLEAGSLLRIDTERRFTPSQGRELGVVEVSIIVV